MVGWAFKGFFFSVVRCCCSCGFCMVLSRVYLYTYTNWTMNHKKKKKFFVLLVQFYKNLYFPCHSLKMECEKLAQEKTEMQRHYVMVSIMKIWKFLQFSEWQKCVRFSHPPFSLFNFSIMKCHMDWMWKCINRYVISFYFCGGKNSFFFFFFHKCLYCRVL